MNIAKRLALAIFASFVVITLVPSFTARAAAACIPGSPGCETSAPAPYSPAWIATNFVKGANLFWRTVAGWVESVWSKLPFAKSGKSVACDDPKQCQAGFLCLNYCEPGGACDAMAKRCVKGSGNILVEPEFAPCDATNLCGQGLLCSNTCPAGEECRVTHRCLSTSEAGAEACAADADCRATCAKRQFPPVGVIGWLAACDNGQCGCRLQEANPATSLVDCPVGLETADLSCPSGTASGCTLGVCTGGNCRPHLSCLTAPEFGGGCLNDEQCSKVACAAGLTPFCAPEEWRCHCRSVVNEVIKCSSAADCSAIACSPEEEVACAEGACACAKKTVVEQVETCSAASDCDVTCPSGFSEACVDSKCACQRTVVGAPVQCSKVEDCSAISCPEGFTKDCINSQCACTRTKPQ